MQTSPLQPSVQAQAPLQALQPSLRVLPLQEPYPTCFALLQLLCCPHQLASDASCPKKARTVVCGIIAGLLMRRCTLLILLLPRCLKIHYSARRRRMTVLLPVCERFVILLLQERSVRIEDRSAKVGADLFQFVERDKLFHNVWIIEALR